MSMTKSPSLLRTNGQGRRVSRHSVDGKDHGIGAIGAGQPGNDDIDLIQSHKSRRDAGELYVRGKSIDRHGCGGRDLVSVGRRSGPERRIHRTKTGSNRTVTMVTANSREGGQAEVEAHGVVLLSVWLAEEAPARFEELVPTECGARRVPTSLLVRAAPLALC